MLLFLMSELRAYQFLYFLVSTDVDGEISIINITTQNAELTPSLRAWLRFSLGLIWCFNSK